MSFFNPVQAIENQLLGELKHHPEVREGLAAIDAGCKAVEGIMKRLTVSEIMLGLHSLNAAVGNKFSETELGVAAQAIARIPEGLHKIEGVVEASEAKLD